MGSVFQTPVAPLYLNCSLFLWLPQWQYIPIQTSWVFLTIENMVDIFSLEKLLSLANWIV